MDEEKIIPQNDAVVVHEDETVLDKTVKNHILPYLKDIAGALLIILVAFLFCFRIAIVDGTSMLDTLHHGDTLLLLNNTIAGEPKQGDIVVVSKSTFKNGEPIIKRVIATEGQTVEIDIENGIVKVDGQILYEPYIKELTSTVYEGIEYPLTVEEGCVFVMGDNRNNSLDSRYPTIGQVDCREIIGEAILIVWPGNKDYSRIGAIS